MRHILVLLTTIMLSMQGLCKSPAKFQFGIDYNYSLGLSQHGLGQTVTYNEFEMHGNSLHLIGLYNINKMFTTGVGIGLDCYRPSPNTFPVFATFRFRPFKNPKIHDFYTFTNLGYGIPADDDDQFSSGFLWNLGIGWQKMLRRHFGLNLQIGYGLNQFRANYHEWTDNYEDLITYKINIWRNSIFFGFGLVF